MGRNRIAEQDRRSVHIHSIQRSDRAAVRRQDRDEPHSAQEPDEAPIPAYHEKLRPPQSFYEVYVLLPNGKLGKKAPFVFEHGRMLPVFSMEDSEPLSHRFLEENYRSVVIEVTDKEFEGTYHVAFRPENRVEARPAVRTR